MIKKIQVLALILFIFCLGLAFSTYAGVVNIEEPCWITEKDDFQISDMEKLFFRLQKLSQYSARLFRVLSGGSL